MGSNFEEGLLARLLFLLLEIEGSLAEKPHNTSGGGSRKGSWAPG